ncbi:hypothetical protein BG015_008563 [Linnemannia schmuckeri]|uniref:Uncharacterized protein n=1 Tax=Linnemannia schmuckeri TaxID=64567 RepID=A0A9P5VAK8_9FUNG|nr:hypothetical protein BG015_008563 [Linnemannia schmuckeri]
MLKSTRARAEGCSDSTFSDRSDATCSSSLPSGLKSGKETEHRVQLSIISALLLEQILEGVNRLNDRMDLLTEQVEEIQGQANHNEYQVQKLIVNSASMDTHTESLRINVDLFGEYIGDMLQENREIKNQLRDIKSHLGRGNTVVEDPHRKTMTPPKEQQQEKCSAASFCVSTPSTSQNESCARWQFSRQTRTVNVMNRRMEWLADQVEEIQCQSASLKSHTEFIWIDMDMARDHLGGLLEDNSELKEQFEGVQLQTA